MVVCHRGGDKFFLAGEMRKAVPMSPRRVRSVSTSPADTSVELVGSPGEVVQFDVCDVPAHCDAVRLDYCNAAVRCRTVNCTIGDSGTARLSSLHSVCY